MATSLDLTVNSPRFDHIYYLLQNGFCHTSIIGFKERGSFQRSARKFCLKGVYAIVYVIVMSVKHANLSKIK